MIVCCCVFIYRQPNVPLIKLTTTFLVWSPVIDCASNCDVDYVDTWKAIEELQRKGLTRSLGVSNFNSKQIERLLKVASIVPVTNQTTLDSRASAPASGNFGQASPFLVFSEKTNTKWEARFAVVVSALIGEVGPSAPFLLFNIRTYAIPKITLCAKSGALWN
ncbi:Alcohol dehydrogenase [NADP(+)] A-like Protein [Tribolium castaneum]|uniref:Alcohol dehydrogenase [NADP(+)] A-like Protein n=1 Tax=Tribolium castaneum TaxID=7070 RepID=D6WWT4_TRICA|nr:Alcohol dehydrogenase [NADP(+)] A-like Protein [Tribolium castaneum]